MAPLKSLLEIAFGPVYPVIFLMARYVKGVGKIYQKRGRSVGISRHQKKYPPRDFLKQKNSAPRDFFQQKNSAPRDFFVQKNSAPRDLGRLKKVYAPW